MFVKRSNSKLLLTVLVIAHAIASAWHGQAHDALAVVLSPAQTVFVYGAILIAPLAGTAMLWTRAGRAGAWIVLLSMFGAFVFGIYYHYIAVSPDHVSHLPAGPAAAHSAFILSAATIATLEFLTTVAAATVVFGRLRDVPARA